MMLLDYLERRKTPVSTAELAQLFKRSDSWVLSHTKKLIEEGLVTSEIKLHRSSLTRRQRPCYFFSAVNKKLKKPKRTKIVIGDEWRSHDPFNLTL